MKSKDTKKKKKKSKKRGILKKVLLCILIALIIALGYFVYKVQKNGGGAQGIVATMLGTDMSSKKEMPKINVLLLGASQNLTDTIMIASYDPTMQTATLMSIPRDTFVGKDKNKATASDKINSLYQYGPEKTLKAVNEVTGLNLKYYLAVDTKALRELVDAIGGVTFDVPIDMHYTDTSQGLYIDVKAGEQLLDGDKAEQVVRFRHNDDGSSYPMSYGDNDIGRMRTQREFMITVAKQTLKPSNITKLLKLIDIAKSNIKTNIEYDVMKDYIPHMVEFNTDNIVTATLPGQPEKCNGVWLYTKNAKETTALVDELFLSTYLAMPTSDENVEKTNDETINNIISLLTNEQKAENKKISIRIIDGSNSDSGAETVAANLKKAGYTIEKTVSSSAVIKTTIINRSDISQEKMSSIKQIIGLGNITTGKTSSKADVTILLGRDY